ncbi:MAG: HAMP domain-containing histidine kinase [Bdellovibrionales bacterium]|nr:HAMP domain-containing histidine kinase [Oligoflexia bacterium]
MTYHELGNPQSDQNDDLQNVAMAQAAHDIRSPLTALNIILKLHILEMSPASRELAESAIARINQIADDILTVNKLSAKRNRLNSCQVASAIRRVISEKRLNNSHVNISNAWKSSNEKIEAEISTITFQRILSNIVDNAFEAIFHEHGNIEIILTEDDGFAVVEVTDNGSGIHREQLAKIGRSGYTLKPNGHGLAINQAITYLDSVGGDISVKSHLNHGSTFRIRIPLAL